MITLEKSLNQWKTKLFNDTLKSEILSIEASRLPLHLATSQGGIINPSNIGLMILSTNEDTESLQVKIGFFFSEIVGGCNCDDDPVEFNCYAIFMLNIDKSSAICSFTLMPD